MLHSINIVSLVPSSGPKTEYSTHPPHHRSQSSSGPRSCASYRLQPLVRSIVLPKDQTSGASARQQALGQASEQTRESANFSRVHLIPSCLSNPSYLPSTKKTNTALHAESATKQAFWSSETPMHSSHRPISNPLKPMRISIAGWALGRFCLDLLTYFAPLCQQALSHYWSE
jgi:hypothetical protein